MPITASNGLTDRQTEILDYIRKYTTERGYSPSTRDIGAGCGITSPNGVMCHIKSLIRKGALERVKVNGRALGRSFRIVSPIGRKPTTFQIIEAVAERFGAEGSGAFTNDADISEVVKFVLSFK